jgi:hypothetical protein
MQDTVLRDSTNENRRTAAVFRVIVDHFRGVESDRLNHVVVRDFPLDLPDVGVYFLPVLTVPEGFDNIPCHLA